MNELIERLRSVKWEVTDDFDRMPDDPTQKCVFVDMRPDDFEALLNEAAAALEAAREDAERWRSLMAAAKEHTRWSIFDAAIDQARKKENGNG